MSIRAQMRRFSLEHRTAAQGEAGAPEWIWKPVRETFAAMYRRSGRTVGEQGLVCLDEYVAIAESGPYKRFMRLCDDTGCYLVESVEQLGRFAVLLCSREEDAV